MTSPRTPLHCQSRVWPHASARHHWTLLQQLVFTTSHGPRKDCWQLATMHVETAVLLTTSLHLTGTRSHTYMTSLFLCMVPRSFQSWTFSSMPSDPGKSCWHTKNCHHCPFWPQIPSHALWSSQCCSDLAALYGPGTARTPIQLRLPRQPADRQLITRRAPAAPLCHPCSFTAPRHHYQSRYICPFSWAFGVFGTPWWHHWHKAKSRLSVTFPSLPPSASYMSFLG